jgi:hypothetical protein
MIYIYIPLGGNKPEVSYPDEQVPTSSSRGICKSWLLSISHWTRQLKSQPPVHNWCYAFSFVSFLVFSNRNESNVPVVTSRGRRRGTTAMHTTATTTTTTTSSCWAMDQTTPSRIYSMPFCSTKTTCSQGKRCRPRPPTLTLDLTRTRTRVRPEPGPD